MLTPDSPTLPIDGNFRPGAAIWAGATSFPCTVVLPNDCTISVNGNFSFELQSGIGIGSVLGDGAMWGFSSQHPGGVLFAVSDGSVKFISETIESRIGAAIAPVALDGERLGGNEVYESALKRAVVKEVREDAASKDDE